MRLHLSPLVDQHKAMIAVEEELDAPGLELAAEWGMSDAAQAGLAAAEALFPPAGVR